MKNISPAEIARIDHWQQARQKAFKTVPAEGKMINYLGKEFLTFPNTFWPFKDSEPLVRNLRIRAGESVLDVGTGSGVIAVFSCYRGAGRVVALDINPAAVKSAKHNIKLHGFERIAKVKRSDLFDKVAGETFDVITANLPFRNKEAPDVVAKSQWDTDLQTNKRFLQEAGRFLAPGGRIYFAQSNFGAIGEIRKLAKAAGFSIRAMKDDSPKDADSKKFYVFLLKKAV